MQPILTIPKLDIVFEAENKPYPVVSNFQLSLQCGQCVGLVGESGSGKTISALSILQLLPPTARVSQDSNIIFHEKNLLDFSEKQMRHVRGKCISMIFQDAMTAFNPVLTIGQQLHETIRLHLRFNKRENKLRALFLLEQVGIEDISRCYDAYPFELSGGMRQRAMIAMAIAAEPDIIIADEPTTALDVTIQKQIIDLLIDLKNKKNCAFLFIGHDLSIVKKMADEVIVLKEGKIVEKNNATLFFQKPHHPYSQLLFDAILPLTPEKKNKITSDSLLTVNQLKVYFPIRSGILKRTTGYVKAVENATLTIKKGETLALVGESGSGKTTTAKGILQLIHNTDGKVIFENNSLPDLSYRQLRRLRSDMQIIFQDPSSALNPRMIIFDSLCEGLLIQKKIKNKKQANAMVDDVLTQVELPTEFKNRYPHELSGGQRQRICIARALTLSPKLLVLDEPTSALDVSTQKQILALLNNLQNTLGISYLLITHNLPIVAYLAHRVAVMYRGEIVEEGDVSDILTAPQHAYTQNLMGSVYA